MLNIILSLFIMYALFASPAQADQGGREYEDLKIGSRAKRGYNNHGTVQYNYTEVPRQRDERVENKDHGNIEIENPRVRAVYNRVMIHGDVSAERESREIGTVTVTPRGSVDVDNKVTINGNVSARNGNLEIGTTRFSERNTGESRRTSKRHKGDHDR